MKAWVERVWELVLDVREGLAFDWRKRVVHLLLQDSPGGYPFDVASIGCAFECWFAEEVESGASGSLVGARMELVTHQLPLLFGVGWKLEFPVGALAGEVQLGIDDGYPVA